MAASARFLRAFKRNRSLSPSPTRAFGVYRPCPRQHDGAASHNLDDVKLTAFTRYGVSLSSPQAYIQDAAVKAAKTTTKIDHSSSITADKCGTAQEGLMQMEQLSDEKIDKAGNGGSNFNVKMHGSNESNYNRRGSSGSNESNYNRRGSSGSNESNYNRRGSSGSGSNESNYNRHGSNESISNYKRRGSNLSNSSASNSGNDICVDNSSGRLECINNIYTESTNNTSSKSQNSAKSAKDQKEYQSGEWGPDIILYSAPSGSNSGNHSKNSGGPRRGRRPKRLLYKKKQKHVKLVHTPPAIMEQDGMCLLGAPILKRQRIGSFIYSEPKEKDKYQNDPDELCVDTGSRSIFASRSIKSLKKFKNLKILGRGGFGVVVTALYREKPVAVKVLKNCYNHKLKHRSLEGEELAMDLCHPHIVMTLAVVDVAQKHALVIMEVGGASNLHQIIHNKKTREAFSDTTIASITYQIASALQYCHSHYIAHLDVKPGNVLLSDNYHCKLADFGCARRIYDASDPSQLQPFSVSPVRGTVVYQAPEVLSGMVPTIKADIYALGVTLWQLLTRLAPFQGEHGHVVLYKVVARGFRPTLPSPKSEFDTRAIDLVQQCWAEQVFLRPSASSVQNHVQNHWTAAVCQCCSSM